MVLDVDLELVTVAVPPVVFLPALGLLH